MLAGARDPETGAGFDHGATARRSQHHDPCRPRNHRRHPLLVGLSGRPSTPTSRIAWRTRLPRSIWNPTRASAAIPLLPLVRAHVDEALRLYPPAFLIVRQAQAADSIMGHAVSPGTTITISPWVLHRHHKRWHAPDAFDPDRFMPGAPPPERYAYMPFGAGPRICVGAQFRPDRGGAGDGRACCARSASRSPAPAPWCRARW